jgi:hypothetical protein
MLSRLAACATVAAVVLFSGCAGLSFQSYGPTNRGHSSTVGAMRADVLASLGEPDSIYRADDTEAFVYHNYNGASWFGLVNTIKRTDTVVVMDDKGEVLAISSVEVGTGRTYLSSPLLGATYPVPATELTEGPDNYSHGENE